MKRFWLGATALVVVAACGRGNPFLESGDTTDESIIPELVAGDVQSFTYDPVAQTLTVSGLDQDDTPFQAVYTRKPNLDLPGYEAYTVQESSLSRHTTAFVQEIDGVRAMIAVSGPQFSYYFGGSNYGRTGVYTPPDVTQAGGIVTYAGTYAGLLNGPGNGNDLLPVAPGTPIDVRPSQAADVTGDVIINADFADNSLNGTIFNRLDVDDNIQLENIDLSPTGIDANGTFTGDVTQSTPNRADRGDYGGVFGGTGATAVAGTLFVSDHIAQFTGEEEYGVFVLAQCGTPNADPLCNQPNQ